jgi:hypothetical protein
VNVFLLTLKLIGAFGNIQLALMRSILLRVVGQCLAKTKVNRMKIKLFVVVFSWINLSIGFLGGLMAWMGVFNFLTGLYAVAMMIMLKRWDVETKAK